jgi:AcrR family transcriptional regulator
MAEPARARPRQGRRAPAPRRSHAERTAETRARLIAAVVESIASVGLARTTAPEIARRAGITWGAVQHHFGGKDGMLMAVLDDSFRRFAERMESIPLQGASLERRVSLFVQRAFEHFGSAHYRSTHEILLHYLGRRGGAGGGARAPRAVAAGGDWRERMLAGLDRLWRRLFADARLPRGRHYLLQHYTISVLAGLATTLMLEGPGAELHPAELALLEDTLKRELARGL